MVDFLNKQLKFGSNPSSITEEKNRIEITNFFNYFFGLYFIFVILYHLSHCNETLLVMSITQFLLILLNHVYFRLKRMQSLYKYLFTSLLTISLCLWIILGAFNDGSLIVAGLVIIPVVNILGVKKGSFFVILIYLVELVVYKYSSNIAWFYNYSDGFKESFHKILLAQLIIFLFSLFINYRHEELIKKINKEKEYKKNIFNNIVHDIKTPITIINNTVDKVLSGSITPEDQEATRKNIKRIENNILNILDLNRIQEGIYRNESIEKLNISETVKDIYNLFLDYCNSKKIKLEHNIKDNLVIRIDHTSFTQIVNNLLDNAFKYTNEGGSITINLYSKYSSVYLEVIDTGIGISSDEHESVFNSYYRGSNVCGKYNGLGLGLGFVSELVNRFNGRIKFKSTPGQGTCFTIKFNQVHNTGGKIKKINQLNIAPEKEKIPNRIIKHNSEVYTILVIDDDVDILNLIINELSSSFNLLIAKDGLEALDHINKEQCIDLILSDIKMPNMGGEELLNELNKMKDGPIIPLIYITASNNKSVNRELLSKGAIDFINKPFSIYELKEKVVSILEFINKKEKEALKKLNSKLKEFLTKDLINAEPVANEINVRALRDNSISKKEELIIVELSKGYSHKEIADSMGISPNTVRTYVYRIYKKCNIQNLAGLMNLFFKSS